MATSLTLTQQQKLQVKLSPAQIQVMRMLELPACELQARINEELQENPALEEGREQVNDTEYQDTEIVDDEYQNPLQNDDFNYDDYVQDDESQQRKYARRNTILCRYQFWRIPQITNLPNQNGQTRSTYRKVRGR